MPPTRRRGHATRSSNTTPPPPPIQPKGRINSNHGKLSVDENFEHEQNQNIKQIDGNIKNIENIENDNNNNTNNNNNNNNNNNTTTNDKLDIEHDVIYKEFHSILKTVPNSEPDLKTLDDLRIKFYQFRKFLIAQLLHLNVPVNDFKSYIAIPEISKIIINGDKLNNKKAELPAIHIKIEKRKIDEIDNNDSGNIDSDNDNNQSIDLTSSIPKQDDDYIRPPNKKIKIKLEDNDEVNYNEDDGNHNNGNDDNGNDNNGNDDNGNTAAAAAAYDDDDDDKISKPSGIKLIIPSLHSDDEDDEKKVTKDPIFIPSVYKSNPDANKPIAMDDLLSSINENLNLYTDEKNKAISTSELEYKKRKYAVSKFPDSDLKDRLPGEIPMTDFSGPKPTQQIAWNSFSSYIDPYFRNFNEDDLKWLKMKFIASNFLSKYLQSIEDNANNNSNNNPSNNTNNGTTNNTNSNINTPSTNHSNTNNNNSNIHSSFTVIPTNDNNPLNPYYIPPLGPKYSDVWNLESEGKSIKMSKLNSSLSTKLKRINSAKGGSEDLESNVFEDEDKISCGPLTSRLLSAIVSDDEIEDVEKKDTKRKNVDKGQKDVNNVDGDDYNNNNNEDKVDIDLDINMTFDQLEKRLNRELNYIGIFMNVIQTLNNSTWEQDWGLGKEDDEICKELRNLQKRLMKIQSLNNFRKFKIIPIIEEQIAWQEYIMIVDDLDKQVEQHYRRRINTTPKKNKKNHSSHSNTRSNATNNNDHDTEDSAHLVSNASFKGLLDKRNKWISKIGSLFKSPWEMRRMPIESIFKEEEDVDQEKENTNENAEDVDDESVTNKGTDKAQNEEEEDEEEDEEDDDEEEEGEEEGEEEEEEDDDDDEDDDENEDDNNDDDNDEGDNEEDEEDEGEEEEEEEDEEEEDDEEDENDDENEDIENEEVLEPIEEDEEDDNDDDEENEDME